MSVPVRVRDFGAACDGVTDDAEALARAITAAREVGVAVILDAAEKEAP